MGKLFEEVAGQIHGLVKKGVYKNGERVPSVRSLSDTLRVSTTTVVEAYRLLEDRGVIAARPQSGYYVTEETAEAVELARATEVPLAVEIGESYLDLRRDNCRADVVSLSWAEPAPDLLPVKRIQKHVVRAAQNVHTITQYDIPPGSQDLRVAIAKRALEAGCQFAPEDIVLTTGCQEAMTLCLRAVCKAGDVVAVESPTYYGQLKAAEMLDLRVLEIPSDPIHGISLDALQLAFEHMSVKAVILTPSHSNPTGSCMDIESRKVAVELAAKFEVALIEDDIYGDLGYEDGRLPAVQSFDRSGTVLYCSSFSKTLAPGYRLGWTAPGRYRREIEKLKTLSNLASPSLMAQGMAGFLQEANLERYLRVMKREYFQRTKAMREAVLAKFPSGTRVAMPRGGFVLWVELPRHFDTEELYPKALAKGVSFAPGPIFSAGSRYRHCMRLTSSVWGPEQEAALDIIAGLLAK